MVTMLRNISAITLSVVIVLFTLWHATDTSISLFHGLIVHPFSMLMGLSALLLLRKNSSENPGCFRS